MPAVDSGTRGVLGWSDPFDRSMMLRLPIVVLIALPGFAPRGSSAAAPANNEWKDGRGASFRGEPVETLGPMAMFRTGAVSSKFMPLRALSLEDCVRFHQAIANRPARRERWSEAKGEATRDCIGRLRRAERGQLQGFDFSSVPEPELLIVLYGGRRDPDAAAPHYLLDNLAPFINRVQRVYPGRVAAVVWATRQANLNVRSLPNARTWLVADPDKQYGMKRVAAFAPGAGIIMVLMTREGVPLLGGPANDVGEVMEFVDRASDILWQLNPANPRSARDRLHYLRATRPVEFAAARAEPLLLIDPLKPEALRERGVTRIEAKFEVTADGKVAQLDVLPISELPAPLAPLIAEALRRSSIFLPAIDHGVAVAATYRYAAKIEAPDPRLAADAAWVKGEARVDIPLKHWLALKPVKVPEQVFSTVDHIGPDGTVMLKAITAGKAGQVSTASQMNSFNSDWFEETGGAASVQPIAGARQEVDGEKLVWKRMTAEHGRVDFLEGGGYNSHDFCIGYAWTEFESPAAGDAWLGLGSDDGVKVWLNGELVDDKWVARTSRLDDDVVPLRLKPGRNQLLIKIQNVHGLWCFTCRLRVRGS